MKMVKSKRTCEENGFLLTNQPTNQPEASNGDVL
jgi:hypothetical protein